MMNGSTPKGTAPLTRSSLHRGRAAALPTPAEYMTDEKGRLFQYSRKKKGYVKAGNLGIAEHRKHVLTRLAVSGSHFIDKPQTRDDRMSTDTASDASSTTISSASSKKQLSWAEDETGTVLTHTKEIVALAPATRGKDSSQDQRDAVIAGSIVSEEINAEQAAIRTEYIRSNPDNAATREKIERVKIEVQSLVSYAHQAKHP